MKSAFLVLFLFLLFSSIQAQNPIKDENIFLSKITDKLNYFSSKRKISTANYLKKFNKSQETFLKKLCKKDSQKADALYRELAQSQQRLNRKVSGQYKNPFEKTTATYNSYNDTLFNALNCSGDNKALNAAGNYKKQLQNENYIRDYMRQQKLSMKNASLEVPSMKYFFRGIDKSSYYYVQQLNDYDRSFSQIDQWENFGINLLKQKTDFSKLMSENSQATSLASIPNDWGKDITGLQTNELVKASQQKDWNNLTEEGKELAKDKLTDGAKQISRMKTDLPKISNAADVPEFTPNPLKTKRTIDRLHYGFDFQFNHQSSMVPKGITLGLNSEYDLLPKLDIGLGFAYYSSFQKTYSENKNDIPKPFTIRFYSDYKIRSLLFFTFNYERIYPKTFNTWTHNAMAGLKLKYPKAKKLAPYISFMYNFLYEQQVPKTQMIVYRIGWIF
jgi:hypothetical protein